MTNCPDVLANANANSLEFVEIRLSNHAITEVIPITVGTVKSHMRRSVGKFSLAASICPDA